MTMSAVEAETRRAPAPGPVRAGDRIETLDILRGFAVLGILAVNAVAFAWPGMMSTTSATVPFPMDGDNRWAVWAVDVFFHNKCRTLFSMLFGVSVFLVGGERRDGEREPILNRRLLWLALFGALHGLALWFGDILLLYAWSGLFIGMARSWTPKRLMWVGVLLVFAFSLLTFAGENVPALMEATPTPAEFAEQVEKGRAEILKSVDLVQSGYVAAMLENLKMWAFVQGASLVAFVFPTVGLMMIGLSLFKTGFLAGRSSSWAYLRALMIGAAITAVFGVIHWQLLDPAMAPLPVLFANSALDLLAPFVTLAWVGLLVLMTRHGLGFISRRLAPVGKMAFTNYLTQTLIMTSIFYMPWGPHLYGKVDPSGLWAIVGGVWLLQLIWSPLWLSRFEMGPLEWGWRCLTYRRRVPLLKRA